LFLACQYVLYCVYSGLSVDCFNKEYHHHHHSKDEQAICMKFLPLIAE